MRRRDAVIFLAAAAMFRPIPGVAQQHQRERVVGFLSGVSPGTYSTFVAAVRSGLASIGYVEGKNLKIEYRWAEDDPDRLPGLADDLVRQGVEVILASGGASRAARKATGSIPIVFVLGSDPVAAGIVASLSNPAGNITGVSFLTFELMPKRLELLHELVSGATTVALLVNPITPGGANYAKATEEAAQRLGIRLHTVEAKREEDFDPVFAAINDFRVGALLVGTDPLFTDKRDRLVALAAAHHIPASYAWREFVDAGGLMSYGTSLAGAYHEAGVYAGRILNGDKPAELPVIQPIKFELVINLKTAKTLGLTVPQSLLQRADEVIE